VRAENRWSCGQIINNIKPTKLVKLTTSYGCYFYEFYFNSVKVNLLHLVYIEFPVTVTLIIANLITDGNKQ
jgi:hypothetical protein